MKTINIAVCIALMLATASVAAGVIPVHRWDIETDDATPQLREIIRGETIHLQPRFLDSRVPMDLTSVYEVALRYRSADMPTGSYYIVFGQVHSATNGEVRITWTPSNEPPASTCQYSIVAQSAAGMNMRGIGTLRFMGSIQGDPAAMTPTVSASFDWAQITEHINPEAAPFVGPGDLLGVNQRLDGHDTAISHVTDLVGDGVAGVTSNLQAHVAGQVIRDAGQDEAIEAAAAGATMGGTDISGQSSNAVVVATRGRTLPLANDTPGHQQAIVWSTNLNRYVHGSVDLSGINQSISNLQAGAVTKSYVDTEISEVRGLVDGNEHTLQLTESFASADWLEIASGVWQHTSGWMAYGANIVGGNLVLSVSQGYLVMNATQCVSRIALTPSAGIWSASYATNATPSTWWGYDAARDNIPATNMFWVKLWNTSGSPLTVGQIQLYTWQFPERVGFTRDFAGLYLDVDTPSGSRSREAANVGYVRTLAATGDISGTFATGFRADKIAQGVVNNTARANGYGLIWYQSVSEHRYVDMATQFELDAAAALLATWTAHSNLVARMTAAEAGGIAISGDVTGSHLQSTRVDKIQNKPIDAPTINQTTPVYDLAQGKIVWRSIVASNAVYSAGTNDIATFPAAAAGFYRAMYASNAIMPLVVDQQILGWLGQDGLTIPYGTLNILQSNLTANVRLYDGSAAQPSLASVSDPDTGWYRAAEDTWRYVAAGNLVADFGPGGLTMKPGKYITLQSGQRVASTGDVAAVAGQIGAVSSRVSAVESWPTGTWSQAYSWGNHASAGYVTGTPWSLMGYVTGTPWTAMGYIGAAAATSAAEAVIAPYTGSIAFAVQPTDPDYTNTVALAAGALQEHQSAEDMIRSGRGHVHATNSNDRVFLDFVSYPGGEHQKAGIRWQDDSSELFQYQYDGSLVWAYWVEQGSGYDTGYIPFASINPETGFKSEKMTIGGATITTSGTNILIIIGGVTNRVVLEAYP